jgi:hypothetical protein
MRLNGTPVVQHHPAGIFAPVAPERLGMARTLYGRCKREHVSALTLPPPEIPFAERTRVLDARLLLMPAASVRAF